MEAFETVPNIKFVIFVSDKHKPSMIITIINGPNLNLLGNRENEIYGNIRFEDYLLKLKRVFPGIDFIYFQSNVEGEIVSALQEFSGKGEGIILNAAGYTHTSVSIADAVAACPVPVIEVHISNLLGREEYRHKSLIAPYCRGSLFGFGLDGYRLAAEALLNILNDNR
ncbi:MAG: type II 3-dehydroquinate dehydratase [Bacteroidales bacterium]|nr:type II 3-dehydroquinate dehydratase [Bacteroidales bacterium]